MTTQETKVIWVKTKATRQLREQEHGRRTSALTAQKTLAIGKEIAKSTQHDEGRTTTEKSHAAIAQSKQTNKGPTLAPIVSADSRVHKETRCVTSDEDG